MAIYNAGSGGGSGSGYSVVSLSSNISSLSLDADTTSGTFTITYEGDGELTATSSDTSIATVALVSGKTYRVTAASNVQGSATITVKASVGAKTIPANKVTIDVTVDTIVATSVLNDNAWSVISSMSAAGQGDNYWDVGDRKAVTLNGTVGTLSLSNVTLYVYIIGFDHNSAKEGSGISFGTFKSALTGGADVALCDSYYNNYESYSGAKYFQMNHWGSSSNYNTNYGGWAACDMRYDILGSTDQAPTPYGSVKTTSATGANPSATCTSNPKANTLMAALPSELRNVLKPITKYTDNKGNSSNTAANVTTTIDYLPLLSEYEVQGARSYANQYEYTDSKQAQYQYYKNGNSKIKYKHNATSTACGWWVRSARYDTSRAFCRVDTDGGAHTNTASRSNGLAPAFLV